MNTHSLREEGVNPSIFSGFSEVPETRLPVMAVCERLRSLYGKPRLGNPKNVLDDLVFIVISNKTSLKMAVQTFRRMKETYGDWNELLDRPLGTLRSLLKPAGLSNVKSDQLRRALRKIRRDCGTCDLEALKHKSHDAVHEYLTSLPGVSDKVSKCVMMYTMGALVLPVDAHVHRVATRLGWTNRKRADQCHRELEALVPPKWRYAFHVDCILHSRNVCRPHEPHCASCCVSEFCEYFRAWRHNG
jgi:endonuclease III